MPIRQRKKIGNSLLVAGAGVTVSMVSSCIATSGNFMSPPVVQLCIDVEPETATVVLSDAYMYEDTAENGGSYSETVADGACTYLNDYSTVTINATAEGYEDYTEEIMVDGSMTHTIEMVAESAGSNPSDTGGNK